MKKLLTALLMLVSLPAFGQNAVTQDGTVQVNKPAMFSGDRRIRQSAGQDGGPANRMITGGSAVVGSVCAYSDTTDKTHSKMCLNPNGTVSIDDSSFNFPGAGNGDVLAPSPTAGNGEMTLWAGGTGLKSAWDGTSNIVGTPVTNPYSNFAPLVMVTRKGGLNAFVGAAENDRPPNTIALPTGVTGYGRVSAGSTGNSVFGMFGLAELYAATGAVQAGEFTVTNFTGLAPDTALPPNAAYGTTTRAIKGINVTCGAQGSQDCSLGMHITNEAQNYNNWSFTTGMYIHTFRSIGMVIEAQPSGNQSTAIMKNNGNGITLQMKATAVPNPLNAMWVGYDQADAVIGAMTYGGDLYIKGKFKVKQPVSPTIASCGTGPSLANGNDQAATVTVGTGGVINSCVINFAVAYTRPPACAFSVGAGTPPVFLASRSQSSITVGSTGDLAGKGFDYACFDQL